MFAHDMSFSVSSSFQYTRVLDAAFKTVPLCGIYFQKNVYAIGLTPGSLYNMNHPNLPYRFKPMHTSHGRFSTEFWCGRSER